MDKEFKYIFEVIILVAIIAILLFVFYLSTGSLYRISSHSDILKRNKHTESFGEYMKNFSNFFSDFYKVLSFSTQLSVKGSLKYFILIILFNSMSVVMPFIMIYLGSIIIQLVAGGIVNGGVDGVVLKKLIFVSILSLLVVFFNKIIEKAKSYCDGMHREIMHKHIQYIIMEKAAGLDLNYFDSYNFYNELND